MPPDISFRSVASKLGGFRRRRRVERADLAGSLPGDAARRGVLGHAFQEDMGAPGSGASQRVRKRASRNAPKAGVSQGFGGFGGIEGPCKEDFDKLQSGLAGQVK